MPLLSLFLITSFAFLLNGCADPDRLEKFKAERKAYYASLPKPVTPPREKTFEESEYAGFDQKGTGTITGTAAVQKMTGQVIPGLGIGIMLLPETAYTVEVVTKEFIPRKDLTPERDIRLMKYVRLTRANAEGKFKFENIPPGKYIVYGRITATIPVTAQLTLGEGETRDVLVTQ